MSAYSAAGGLTVYVDDRYLNQCEVGGEAGGPIRCTVISSDLRYSLAFALDQSDRGILGRQIARISSLVEHTRATC
jgi:hypothetical protein